MTEKYKVSARQSCKVLGLQESTLYYHKQSQRDDTKLKEKMMSLCKEKSSYGRPRVTWYLREVAGFKDNHKRIARLYRELDLQLGKKRKKTKIRRSPLRLVDNLPTEPNDTWAMDFVGDSLSTGYRFRCLTVVDLYSRESPTITVDRSLTGERVSKELDKLKIKRGLPKKIICDNGPEFISKALDQWAYQNGVHLNFIQPGKPNQNAYCESFNARLRDECLNQHWFTNLRSAQETIESWRKEYNEERPHSSLKNKTPKMFAKEHYRNVAA